MDTVYSVRIRNASLVLLGFPFFNLFICSEVQTTVSISKVSYFMWYLFIYLFIGLSFSDHTVPFENLGYLTSSKQTQSTSILLNM